MGRATKVLARAQVAAITACKLDMSQRWAWERHVERREAVDDGVGEDGDDDVEFAATTFQKAMHDVLMEYKRRA